MCPVKFTEFVGRVPEGQEDFSSTLYSFLQGHITFLSKHYGQSTTNKKMTPHSFVTYVLRREIHNNTLIVLIISVFSVDGPSRTTSTVT